MAGIDLSQLPPGFGFHPTDAELISHYLWRKIIGVREDREVIPELDIYKYEPWDLPGRSGFPSRACKWHFFNVRDRKYPNGSRSNRATQKGYWKSTGKDRMVRSDKSVIGTKKTLVFHEGRPPAGKRTDWIMHEYYLDEKAFSTAGVAKDIFVLCRITKRNGFTSKEEVCAGVQKAQSSTTNISGESSIETERGPKIPLVHNVEEEKREDYSDWIAELRREPSFPNTFSEISKPLEFDYNAISSVPFSEEMSALMTLELPFDDSSYIFPEDFQYTLPFHPPENGVSVFTVNPLEEIPHDSKRTNVEEVEEPVPSDTGIILRHRPQRDLAGTSGHRIRLQVHKMESGKPGVTSHMVKLDTSNHQLNPADFKDVSSSEDKHELPSNVPVSKATTILEETTDGNYRNAEASRVRQAGMKSQLEDVLQPPQRASQKKDARPWCGMKRSLRGALAEAKAFLRSCSSFGPRCLLLWTCLAGVSTMICCFHQEDP